MTVKSGVAGLEAAIHWESRLTVLETEGLLGKAPDRGAKPSIPVAKRDNVITWAMEQSPNGMRWRVRSMAPEIGVSSARPQQFAAGNNIKPHLTGTLIFSRDPNFVAKPWDEIGLYLAPPDRALVFYSDK